jgi:hypothetical protein
MISWTTQREKVLTGYTLETAGSSSSVSDADTGVSDYAGSRSGTTTYAGTSYTSHGATGSTTYFFSSYSSEYIDFTDPDYEGVFSGSTSSSGITTGSLISINAQTSTTETYEYLFEVSLTTATDGSGWSYAGSSFFQVPIGITENTTSEQTGTVTVDAVTENDTVLSSGLADTILQAATSEVIWYFTSITSWNGITAATERATSATRVTIPPLMVLTAIPKVTESTNQNATGVEGNVSYSYLYTDSTYTSQYTTTTTTSKADTTAFLSVLPNDTSSGTTTTARSTSYSFSSVLYYSDEGTGEATDGSTRILSLATVSHDAQPGTFYSGDLTWDAPRTTTTAYSLTTTAPIALCASSRSSISEIFITITDTYGRTLQFASGSSSGKTIDQNTYLPQPPICGLTIGGTLLQSKFVPRAAKIGAASGYWFELLDVSDTITDVTYAKQARSPLETIMPTIAAAATYISDSVTFTKSTQISGQSTTTTSSAIIEVAGTSTTTTVSSGPIGVWGGSPADNETFANVAGADGAYLNRIDKETSSFRCGATTFSSSLPLSSFFPIQGFGPPLGEDVETRLSFGYWTEARNSTALPPTMPPNA